MKKAILLTLALIISATLSAQTFVNETFDGADIPEGWVTYGLGTENWRISSTNYSGGDGKELMLAYSPDFEGTSRIATTAFNLSGVEEITVSFKHFFDNFKDNEFTHKIGIATSADGQTWNVGWSQDYTKTGSYEIKTTFSTPDLGKDNVMFCLFYEGNSHNMDNWFFDDLLIYRQTELDLRLIDINMPNMIETGEREISFSVQNMGLTAVKSFEAKIKASNWGSAVTATFEQSINNLETIQVTYKEQAFNAIARNTPYRISVEIISINGDEDQDASNNYIEKKVNVAFNRAQRIPMVEHFSSSTCGPCVNVNQHMHPLMLENEGRFTYTKFPTAGDPYHNFEAAHRVQVYGITGVPNIFLDGMSKGSNYLTQEMLDERYNTPAYADIRGSFTLDGDKINIIADFMSYVKLDKVLAFVTVNEKTTVENTGSNGETEFHHILMKMLKSKSGNEVSINAGEYQRLVFSHNMSLTNVEELNDLEVALWLQDPITQEIYNSHFAYAYSEHCYPVQNLTLSQNEDEKTLSWDAPEKGTPTYYKVYINAQLVSENSTELSYKFNSSEETFTAEVIAVYENDMTSVGVAKLFGEIEEEISVDAPRNLNANPASTSSINLNWNSVEDAASYNIYRGDDKIANVTETSYTDESLEYDTEYCYTVTSVYEESESEHSNEACVKTLGESVEELNSSAHIYPNPAKDEIHISSEERIEEVRIYNINGQQTTVNSQQTSSTGMIINISKLNSGVYFIKINTEKGNIVKQFIKN